VKKSKLDSPPIKKEVIQRLAVGESQERIARDVGLHQSQISRFVGREDVKPFIEQEQMRLLEAVPEAVQNVKELVREMKKIPKKEIKRRELAYKASLDTLKAGGIMPSPFPSIVIQDNRTYNNPLLQQVLSVHFRSLIGDDSGFQAEDDGQEEEKTDGEKKG